MISNDEFYMFMASKQFCLDRDEFPSKYPCISFNDAKEEYPHHDIPDTQKHYVLIHVAKDKSVPFSINTDSLDSLTSSLHIHLKKINKMCPDVFDVAQMPVYSTTKQTLPFAKALIDFYSNKEVVHEK